MQDVVTVARDFLTTRRQFLRTPVGGSGDTPHSLVLFGEMKALARVLCVDLETMNPPDVAGMTAPITAPAIHELAEHHLLLLSIPAHPEEDLNTPPWSAFITRDDAIGLLKALLHSLDKRPRQSSQSTKPLAPRRPPQVQSSAHPHNSVHALRPPRPRTQPDDPFAERPEPALDHYLDAEMEDRLSGQHDDYGSDFGDDGPGVA